MDLKDLANDDLKERKPPVDAEVMGMGEDSALVYDQKWVVIESRLLSGEQILLVLEKKHLKEARVAHPDKVIYFPPEVDELRREMDAPDFSQFLKSMHLVKKTFSGWVCPSKGYVYERD